MKTIEAIYRGDLRVETTHVRSGNTMITDAPVDNHGKGESFSPTDLLAASTLTCMMTMMGIIARNRELQLGELSGSIKKIMAEGPRRVAALEVELHIAHHHLSDADKTLLENTALACPVTRSLHPDVQLTLKFSYD